jgi:hypothetical protein
VVVVCRLGRRTPATARLWIPSGLSRGCFMTPWWWWWWWWWWRRRWWWWWWWWWCVCARGGGQQRGRLVMMRVSMYGQGQPGHMLARPSTSRTAGGRGVTRAAPQARDIGLACRASACPHEDKVSVRATFGPRLSSEVAWSHGCNEPASVHHRVLL